MRCSFRHAAEIVALLIGVVVLFVIFDVIFTITPRQQLKEKGDIHVAPLEQRSQSWDIHFINPDNSNGFLINAVLDVRNNFYANISFGKDISGRKRISFSAYDYKNGFDVSFSMIYATSSSSAFTHMEPGTTKENAQKIVHSFIETYASDLISAVNKELDSHEWQHEDEIRSIDIKDILKHVESYIKEF